MDKQGSQKPLHKLLHYRRLRDLFWELCRIENINAGDYDGYNMRAYRCYGNTFSGKTFSVTGLGKQACSCFVRDEEYEVIEIPQTHNRKNDPTGFFFLLARNIKHNYWLAGILDVEINVKETREKNQLIEKAEFSILGVYKCNESEKSIVVEKLANAKNCVFEKRLTVNKQEKFDNYENRKLAYGFSYNQLFEKVTGRKISSSNLIDNRTVRIYKKKFKKNQNRKD